MERERFVALLEHGFKEAGCHTQLVSKSGIEMLRQASQGRVRLVSIILKSAMHIATEKRISLLPDDVLQKAITELKS